MRKARAHRLDDRFLRRKAHRQEAHVAFSVPGTRASSAGSSSRSTKCSPNFSCTCLMRASCTTSVPMPKIMRRRSRRALPPSIASSRATARAMPSNDGARDDRVADVQLDDLAGSPRSAARCDSSCRGRHARSARGCSRAAPRREMRCQLARLLLAARIGVGAGVQLDCGRADSHRRFELRRIRIHEQRHADARVGETPAHRPERCDLRRGVEAAFGGHFGAAAPARDSSPPAAPRRRCAPSRRSPPSRNSAASAERPGPRGRRDPGCAGDLRAGAS